MTETKDLMSERDKGFEFRGFVRKGTCFSNDKGLGSQS